MVSGARVKRLLIAFRCAAQWSFRPLSNNKKTTAMRRLRLGVLGEFGQGNLGRDAALVAFVQWMTLHAAQIEPVALFQRSRAGSDPEISADAIATLINDRLAVAGSRSHKQSSATLAGERDAPADDASLAASRSSFASMLRCTSASLRLWPRQLDCVRQLAGVVVLGSGPQDGPTRFGDALRTWSWSLACRWTGKPFVLLSFSAPLAAGVLARKLIRATLRTAAYVSVADLESERWVRAARRGQNVSIAPNPLFDLAFDARWESAVDPWQGRTQPMQAGAAVHTYGVSPARQDLVGADAYERYIGALARLCTATVRSGHRIVLFAVCPVSDRRAVLDLLARVPADVLFGVHAEKGTSVGDVARAVRGVRAVVVSRFHGMLWGLWGARPAVTLGTDTHGAALMRTFAMAHDAAAPVLQESAAHDGEAMVRALASITANYDERRERLTASLARLRAAIDTSYREAFTRGGWGGTVSAPVDRDGLARDGSVAAPGRI